MGGKEFVKYKYNPTRRSYPNPFFYFSRIQLTKFNYLSDV